MKVGDLVHICTPNLFGLREKGAAMVTKVRQTADERGYVPHANHYAYDIVFFNSPYKTVKVFESEVEKMEYAGVVE